MGKIAWNKGEIKKCNNLNCINIIPIYKKYCSQECYWVNKKGKIPWNKNKKDIYSEKTLQKMSKSQKERFKYEDSPRKGKKLLEEQKQKIKLAKTGQNQTQQTKEKISNSLKGNIVWNKGLTKEINNKILNHSIIMKNKWTNQNFVKIVLESNQIKPNKKEIILNQLLQEICSNQFQLNVLATFIVGGKIPDFIDPINNKIIELYGDYWHRGQDPNDRINYFKQYGYNTLVIWEHELKDINNLKGRLLGFINV